MKGTLEAEYQRQSARITALGRRRRLLEVALLSGLGLFVELLLIRWLAPRAVKGWNFWRCRNSS